MSREVIHTHCALRLGDNLAHVHFLRKLSFLHPEELFMHWCHAEYMAQLFPVVRDRRIILRSLAGPKFTWRWGWRPPSGIKSVNAWKNDNGFWEWHSFRNQYATFMLYWFEELASRLGFTDSPFAEPKDLLFDYPGLKPMDARSMNPAPVDFLVVNSQGLSGQSPRYEPREMDCLIRELRRSGKSVIPTAPGEHGCISTQERGLDVTQVGLISQFAKVILMVATGPSWPTFNIFNTETVETRIVISENEVVNFGTDRQNIAVRDVAGVREALQKKGYL